MAKSKPILILNGPNLNMLGSREPEIYGTETLADIQDACETRAAALGLATEWFQSNHEGEMIERIQQSLNKVAGIIINAAAYTHTSIAVMDALLLHDAPIVEVHLSNIYKRESFRHHSHISRVASGVICGFGKDSYLLGLDAMARLVAVD